MRFLFLFVALSCSFSAHADMAFDQNQLAACIARSLKANHSQHDIAERLATADELRVKGATELLEGQENKSFTNSKLINFLVPFSQQDASEVMAFHSSPLFNFEKVNWGKELFHNDTLERLKRLYTDTTDESTNLTLIPNFQNYLDEQIPPFEREAHIPGMDRTFIDMMFAANGISEKLVMALLEVSEKESIGHFELIKKAIEIYDGDVFTALAAIGYIFDIERVSISRRSMKLYLGSRVQPLLVNDRTDVLGDNYHFWMYLNAALQGKGKVAGKMSLTYEGAKGDFRDMKADSAGIDVGTLVRKYIIENKPIPSCNL